MDPLGTIRKVLQLKERREEEIELEVRELRDAVSAQETLLGSLERAYVETLESFARRQRDGSLPPHEMGVFYSYIYHLSQQMDAKKAEIARTLSALDARHGALVEAHKETRIVESLKDRRSLDYAKEESRQERKEMDFLASTLRGDR